MTWPERVACWILLTAAACAPVEERHAGTPVNTPRVFEPPADARKLCAGHVYGAAAHITWAAYYSRELPEPLAARYLQSLGPTLHDRKGRCHTWRQPHDRPVKILDICDVSEKGPWLNCSSPPGDARSIIVISSMVRR